MCFFICAFSPYVEYSTEEDLLKGLKNGSEDQIWLFECKPTANFPLMIVKVHDEAPEIGVQITTREETEDGLNFSDWGFENAFLDDEEAGYDDDDEDCKRLLNVALKKKIRVPKTHIQRCSDVRNVHFLFYFRH